MMRCGWFQLVSWSLLLSVLAGCTGGTDDLGNWTADERRKAVPHVTPVSEPKQYVPLPYTEGKAVDPFNVDRLTKVWDASPAAKQCAALLAVEFNRRKEPLEAFPLDVMSMVGSLQRNGQRVALLKVDKLLYQVRPANYLGQNYGRITQVSENEVTLREIVQDAAGECIERMTTLQLQENTK